MMTKQEILKAIRACAKKLKRNPTLNELRRLAGLNGSRLDKEFGSMGNALTAAGLEGVGSGFEVAESALLLDWAAVTQKAGRIPTAQQYDKAGKFSLGPFYARYERWGRVMEAFRNYARAEKIEGRWKGVIRLIEERREKNRRALTAGNKARRCPLMPDRAVYGDPLLIPEMAHAPVNEAGVVFAFGVMAWRLGFVVHRVQTEFPDCVAMRRMAKGQWQWSRIEFEHESKNFLRHGHKINGCDLIVCWVHNWPECPLPVLELSKEIAKISQLVNG
jgi:HNH endonuclease